MTVDVLEYRARVPAMVAVGCNVYFMSKQFYNQHLLLRKMCTYPTIIRTDE